ncbi:MAG: hypothetical protein PUA95_06720 [Lactimicrobium massiliense]|nr:hypothetical protein [Lactimicrobium massiliense]MDD6230408.1 hypothetical protein [Lactimicrobium massiliense]MDD6560966.1 hypothetical protein [Lactimicrobium massiliense]MDD6727479.1 hypothetical protein [Lactimicrobium massiliense]
MEVSQIVALYKKMLQNDGELRKLKRQISSGDLAALQEYGIRAGQLSVDALQKGTADGIADQNSIIQILDGVFRENYQAVANASQTALKAANQAAGLGLNGSESDFVSTAAQIADRLSGYDDISEGLNSLTNDIVLQSQRYADDSERRSAEFASDSGLEVLVTREYDDVGVHTTDKGGGEVCQWCLDRCGTDVPYDEAYERGMFERHPGCGCIITYRSKRGVVTQQGKSGEWKEISESERQSIIESNERYTQAYKPVIRGNPESIKLLSGSVINAKSIDGYTDVYVSDNAVIKPKSLHNIVSGVNQATAKFAIKEKPKILIASNDECDAIGKYNAVNNTVIFRSEAGDKKIMKNIQEGKVAVNDPYWTQYHEVFHAVQAEEYQKDHGKITEDNYPDYINTLRSKCKSKLDSLGIDEHNVDEISDYAKKMYSHNIYDEVIAEYETLQAFRR